MATLKELSNVYSFLGKLGEGSGGVVYKAYHKNLRKYVVLKKIKQKRSSNELNRKEVDILKNLNHMYLPKVLDFLEIDGDLYTVMDFIPGDSFATLMERGVRFSESQLIRWGMQLCSALNYLHMQKPPIVHCDVKPANIMLRPDGNICLIDFNISFCLYEDTIMGYSNGYSSPELFAYANSYEKRQMMKDQRIIINERIDIYSLGATLYNLATNIRITDRFEMNYELLKANTSEEFAYIVQKALQKNPKDRYESAMDMFHALEHIAESDNRYVKLLKHQQVMKMVYVVGLCFSIILIGLSIFMIHLEKNGHYTDLVTAQVEYREEGKYSKEEKAFEQAVSIKDEDLQTYYQNAYSLYQQGRYNECIEFINQRIIENEKIKEDQLNEENVYYLLADSYFQENLLTDSIQTYEKLFKMDDLDPVFYRDYAIALAHANQSAQANEILNKAIDEGLQEDSIYYAKAEVEHVLNNKEAAFENIQKSIAVSTDNELKQNAYLLEAQWYSDLGNLEQARDVLRLATKDIPMNYQIKILEDLAQVNIDYANRNNDSNARQEAISVLQKIIEQDWGTYQTYDSLVVQFEKLKDYSNATAVLETMKAEYGEDYNYYKRLAFIESELQQELENKNRDYSMFKMYYEKARQLYSTQEEQDSEMDLLEAVYQEVLQGGW